MKPFKKLFKTKKVKNALAAIKSGSYKKGTTTITNLNPTFIRENFHRVGKEKIKRDLTPFVQHRKNPSLRTEIFPGNGYEILLEVVWDGSEDKIVWARVMDVKLVDKTIKKWDRTEIIRNANDMYNDMLKTLDLEQLATDLSEFIQRIIRKSK